MKDDDRHRSGQPHRRRAHDVRAADAHRRGARRATSCPGMRDNLLLHAGPPIEWERMSGPLRGAVIGALIFEGLAKRRGRGGGARASGARWTSSPATTTRRSARWPASTSASMKVYVVEDATHGHRAFSNLNEGYGKVLRYGAFSDEVLDQLRWMNETMAPVLGRGARRGGGHRPARARSPRRCTWATRGTTATRPARCCSSS